MILEPATSSGEKSSSSVILNNSGLLMGVDLLPPASGSAVLKIYDNPSAASGTVLCEVATSAGVAACSAHLAMPIIALRGIYAELTGTTTFVVQFTRTNG